MATTYLSAGSTAIPTGGGASGGSGVSEDQHSSSGGSTSEQEQQQLGVGGGHQEGMNLVNGGGQVSSSSASSGYASAASPTRSLSSMAAEMHETKYLPPPAQHPQAALHNGHPAAAVMHNPWVAAALPDAAAASHWAMHPAAAASLYQQDLKQDIKPHSPADFHRTAASHHMSPHAWNPPVPPASSPYLPMSSTSGPISATGGGGGAGTNLHHPPGSPSPLHQHPAYHGMGGMIPGQIPHPFGPPGGPGGLAGLNGPVGGVGSAAAAAADRFHHRDSHNSSPRSGTDEDGMQTPTSGTSSTSSFFPDSAGKYANAFIITYAYSTLSLHTVFIPVLSVQYVGTYFFDFALVQYLLS